MRVAVIGGSGNFGARICKALAEDRAIDVLACGRSAGTHLDIASPRFPEELRSLSPDLVVHCAGPFQGQDYRVALAALAAGAHYIDLADGRAFVCTFAQATGAAARNAGRLAVSGASTLPALSSAVVDSLAGRCSEIEQIHVVIAPAQRAPRGRATMAGVLGYAGQPFRWWSNGAWREVHGWQELRRVRIDGVGTRWAAACDVPDLELLPARYPGVQTVQFRAALEVGLQHFALWTAAAMRRAGLPLALDRWAGPLDRAAAFLDRLGSERGGMAVTVTGTKPDGSRACIEWRVVADSNHGPEIPCMAAILLARKLAHGELMEQGAHPCMGFLTLADFAPEFARWAMRTTLEERLA